VAYTLAEKNLRNRGALNILYKYKAALSWSIVLKIIDRKHLLLAVFYLTKEKPPLRAAFPQNPFCLDF
jgi:hypothetical protein